MPQRSMVRLGLVVLAAAPLLAGCSDVRRTFGLRPNGAGRIRRRLARAADRCRRTTNCARRGPGAPRPQDGLARERAASVLVRSRHRDGVHHRAPGRPGDPADPGPDGPAGARRRRRGGGPTRNIPPRGGGGDHLPWSPRTKASSTASCSGRTGSSRAPWSTPRRKAGGSVQSSARFDRSTKARGADHSRTPSPRAARRAAGRGCSDRRPGPSPTLTLPGRVGRYRLRHSLPWPATAGITFVPPPRSRSRGRQPNDIRRRGSPSRRPVVGLEQRHAGDLPAAVRLHSIGRSARPTPTPVRPRSGRRAEVGLSPFHDDVEELQPPAADRPVDSAVTITGTVSGVWNIAWMPGLA